MVKEKDLRDFEYAKLKRDTPTTRVISILPPAEHKLIRILIRQYTLPWRDGGIGSDHNFNHYQCLSYRWGDPTGSKYVHIIDEDSQQEGRLLVGPMLHDFLQIQVTRQQSAPSQKMTVSSGMPARDWWWIDSICINQTDDGERAYQVPNMDLIYSKAAAVFIWLGHEPNQTRFMPKRVAIMQEITGDGQIIGRPDIARGTGAIDAIVRDERLHDTRDNQKLYGGSIVSAFYENNPYWHRLWIIQEVFLASQLFVTLADKDISLLQYHQTLLVWRGESQSHERFEDAQEKELKDEMYRLVLRQGSGTEKHEHLDRMRHRLKSGQTQTEQTFSQIILDVDDIAPLCQRPLDQVYGLIAMSDLRGKLAVDYAAPPGQVFADICRLVPRMSESPSLSHPAYKAWISLMRRMGLEERSKFDILLEQAISRPRDLVFRSFGYRSSGDMWFLRLHDNASLSHPTPWASFDLHFFMAPVSPGSDLSSTSVMCLSLVMTGKGKDQMVPIHSDDILIWPLEIDKAGGSFELVVPFALFLQHANWIMHPGDSKARRVLEGSEKRSSSGALRKKNCVLM